jgi:hypothetical protein
MKHSLLIQMCLLLFISSAIVGQNIVYNEIPANLQLYPRDMQDSSEVIISGHVETLGYDTIMVELYKNNQVSKVYKSYLNYQGASAAFNITPKIHAEKSEYSIKIYLDNTLITQSDSIVCGDAYLINGQSNALAIDYDGLATYQSEWLRSFGNLNPGAALDSTWGLAQGHDYTKNAAIGVWGLRLGQLLVENSQIPICIISGATTGSEIVFHLRNDANPMDISSNYGRLLSRTIKSKLKDKIRGIFWNQGESDTENTVSGYSSNFAELYTDWKTDYLNLQKIYIFQIRPCTQGSKQRQLRNVQRIIPEQYSDVEIMSTVGLPGHDGLHYHYNGYKMMGEWIYGLISRDFYNSNDTLNITPPKIQNIFYSPGTQNEITMVFDQPVLWPADTLGATLKDYIYLVGDTFGTTIDSGYVQNNDSVILQLSGSSNATEITYIPNSTYNGSSTIYEGPWLENTRGVGALTFYRFPITDPTYIIEPEKGGVRDKFLLYSNYPNPFNPSTRISFDIVKAAHTTLLVYNIQGEIITEMVDDYLRPGKYTATFNGSNLSSGLYFYMLRSGEKQICKKMMLIK